MTTINSLYSSLYSQLPNQTATPATASSLTASLAAALGQNSGSANNGDIVDLSQQAQAYLGQNSGSNNSNSSDGFVLTRDQLQKISEILAKYKDAPFTKDTFDQIQADLKKAGLSPEQLAAEDSIRSFNITQILISALNGTDDGSVKISTPSDADEQNKSMNYVKQLINSWGDISTTVSSAPADGSAAPAA